MPTVIKKLDANSFQLKDQVVAINRVTKVVKRIRIELLNYCWHSLT